MRKTNIIGVYDDPDVLVSAIKKVKESGIKIKNVFSPFPIHEVFEILGLKTRIPYLTFLYGVFGVLITYAFLYWTSFSPVDCLFLKMKGCKCHVVQ